MTRALRVVHDQGRGRGEDLSERFLLCGTQFDGVDHERFVVRGKNKAGNIATSRPQVALNEHGERRVGASPLGNVAGSIREGHRDLDLGYSLGRLVDGPLPHADAGDLAHLLTQTAELERIEETINGGDIRGAAGQIARRHLKVHVGEQTIEAAVAHDVIHVFTQGRSALSTDLVGPRQQVVQAVVLIDPLCGSLGANAWNAGQVIRGLTHDCGNLGIAVRRDAILLLHRLRSHAAEITGTRPRIQHRDVVSHRLEGVAVAGYDKDRRAIVAGTVRERRENVVRFEALARERHDPHRIEHLANQLHLALEFLGRGVARPLVLRVLLGTE